MRRLIGLVGWLLLGVSAWAQDTPYRLPDVYALRGAKIVSNAAPPIENGVLVVRNGVIVAIGGSETPIPADAEVIDASGHTVYPGFIDAFASLGMPTQANDPRLRQLRAREHAPERADSPRTAGDGADAARFGAALALATRGVYRRTYRAAARDYERAKRGD
jgi:imidazolonepropionase-like amidohydrolase